ncbi:MAG: AAA family ATPase, partial [Bacteroidota bacterium]
RVGLAQAMIHDPDVLILDEPTSGLDPNQIVEIRNLIKKLGRAKTVILSTHILSEVQATCDRVIIINEGKIVADGTPQRLQEEFRGTEIVSVELKANVANVMTDVFPKVRGLPNVESVEYKGQEGSSHRFVVHTHKGSDIREQLFKQAVAEEWVLMEMTRKSTSLEEIFHKLTTSEPAKP